MGRAGATKKKKKNKYPDGDRPGGKIQFPGIRGAELRLKLENKLHPQLSHQVAIIAIKTNKTQAALQKMWPRMNVRCCRAAEPELWLWIEFCEKLKKKRPVVVAIVGRSIEWAIPRVT